MIAKTLISTLLRRKARTLLLLFSIAACASLLFANLGFQRTTEQMIYDADTRWSGNSELYISPQQSVGSEGWIDPDLLAGYRDRLVYDYPMIRTKALFAPDTDQMHYFTVLGTDIEEFNSYNPLTLASGNTDDWAGNKVIVGETYAGILGLSAGDEITLEINGEAHRFLIAGVSQPKGLFLREVADGGFILMPRETLTGIMGGECNLIFLKSNDASSVPALKEELTAAFPEYAVYMGIDPAVIQAETDNYVMPFWFSSILVIFMSVFIIYSCMGLIVNERISILGILRSVGCSRRKTNGILMAESAVIGLVGSALGCVFGLGVLHVIRSVYFSGDTAALEAPLLIGHREILFTVAVSVAITVLSSVLPILKATKAQIKDIILNDYQKQKLKSARLWPLGLVLMAQCALVPGLFGKGMMGMIVSSASATMALIGVIILVPVLCKLAAVAARRFSVDISLGIRNAGDFKALVNSIRLFAVVMAAMIFMMTIFGSLASDLRDSYKRERYDVWLELRETGQESLARLGQTDGVAEFCGVYETYAEMPDYGTFMNAVVGIDGPEYFGFSSAEVSAETLEAIGALSNGRNIVTTNILREKLGLQMGDTLTLRFDTGAYDYVITGFLDTNYGIGHVGYVSSENYKADLGVQDYSKILVKTAGDPAAAKVNIQRTFSRDALSVQTKGEIEAANADKVEGIFNAINTYAYFAMLIGLLGIINNMVGSFMSRQRSIAMYRCIGMSGRSAGRMLAAEAVTIGVIGVLAGIGTGALMMRAVPYVVGVLWGNVSIVAPVSGIALLCAAGMAAMLLSSLIPMARGRNISIMDNLRYE